MTQGSEKTARLRGKCRVPLCGEDRLVGSKFCERHGTRETVRGPVVRKRRIYCFDAETYPGRKVGEW